MAENIRKLEKMIDICQFYGKVYSQILGQYFKGDTQILANIIINSLAEAELEKIPFKQKVEKVKNDIDYLAEKIKLDPVKPNASFFLANDFVRDYMQSKNIFVIKPMASVDDTYIRGVQEKLEAIGPKIHY